MGPLRGIRVVELVGLGPGPFCGMLLADLGAEVLRVDRLTDVAAADTTKPAGNTMHRGKLSVALDLKANGAVEAILRLVEGADALIEVFRPGVAERLGIGPVPCLARNPGLIYGRLTGWGQVGPMAARAGHDIDYIALAGALEPLGRAGQPPTPPINVLGDFAGGGMFLAMGILAALHARSATGGARGIGGGQVIDAAMVDGAALLMAPFYSGRASGGWGPRGTNFIDTGAPFYDVYTTADDKWIAVGAIEPAFYVALLGGLGVALDDPVLGAAHQYEQEMWPAQRAALVGHFATRSRNDWESAFDGLDACVAPVLDPVEAPRHPHAIARGAFVEQHGLPQPAPGPRFSATPPADPGPVSHPGADTDHALRAWGFSPADIARLRADGAVAGGAGT